ncbi:hypothetical protein GCM10020000_59780 [Streptomyces olivoverticillatus]
MMGGADVADGGGAQSGGLQDGGEHLDGGGLAVGAGDGEPGGGPLATQLPGDLDIADHTHARRGRGREERAGGLPAGRGDDEVGALGEGVGVAEADGDALLGAEHAGALAQGRGVAAVDDGHLRAEAWPGRGRR